MRSYPSSQPAFLWRLQASRLVPAEGKVRAQIRMRQVQRDFGLNISITFGWTCSLLFPSHKESSTGLWDLESGPTSEQRAMTGFPRHQQPQEPGRKQILFLRLSALILRLYLGMEQERGGEKHEKFHCPRWPV